MFYDNYPAGTGLVSGATFGRIAGRNAARLALGEKPGHEARRIPGEPAGRSPDASASQGAIGGVPGKSDVGDGWVP